MRKGILISIIALILFTFLSCNHSETYQDPEELITDYINYILKFQYKKAYKLLTEEDKNEITFQEFSHYCTHNYSGSRIRKVRIEEVLSEKNILIAYIDIYKKGGTAINFTPHHLLKKKNNSWYICFKLSRDYENIRYKLCWIATIRMSNLAYPFKTPSLKNEKSELEKFTKMLSIYKEIIDQYGEDHLAVKFLRISSLQRDFENKIKEQKKLINIFSNEVYDVKESDVIKYTEELIYPRIIKKMGIGGKVYIFIDIDEKGNSTNVKLFKTSGSAILDEAYLRWSRAIIFNPLIIKGEFKKYKALLEYELGYAKGEEYSKTKFRFFVVD